MRARCTSYASAKGLQNDLTKEFTKRILKGFTKGAMCYKRGAQLNRAAVLGLISQLQQV